MSLKIVQIGANKGNDELSQYIFDNFSQIEFGLFVEANSFHIEELKKCYENYENVIIENIAIKDPSYLEDTLTIYYHTNEYPHYGIASCNIDHLKKHIDSCPHLQGGNVESFNVSCITLDELFKKYSIYDLDILFLDIEGIDAEVLLSFNWEKYSIKRVEFEYIHLGEHEDDIKKMFEDMGYVQINSLHEYNWAFEKKLEINECLDNFEESENGFIYKKPIKNCIYYCFFGSEIYLPLLELSLKSLNSFFDKENIIVFSDRELPELEKYSKVIVENFPDGYTVPMAYRLILGKKLLKEYDNALHLDIDTIVVNDINHLFNLVENNKISFAKDIGKLSKITDQWWSGPLLTSEELEKYADVNSICCGVFLFNKTCENVLEKIYDYVVEIEETGYRGPCADQHAFSTFVLRNDYYNYNLNDFVDHNGINLAIPIEAYNKSYIDVEHKMFEFDKQICIYHFPGGAIPGKSVIDNKYDSMNTVYNSVLNTNNMCGMVNTRNDLLDLLPKNLRMAELGVFTGEFSKIILEKISPSELFLVDTFPSETCSGDKDGNNVVHLNLDEMYGDIVKKFESYDNVNIIRSTTVDFLNSLEDSYLDAVYIDALHYYENVKEELELSYNKVKKGGFIMGHDYESICFPGVIQAVNEFCEKYNLKINYLTRDGCPTYLIKLDNKNDGNKDMNMKVLFFGRNSRDDVWEHDFILNDVLPKEHFKKTYFLSLEEVRNSLEHFDVFVYSARYPNNYPWGYMPTYNEVLECVLKVRPKIVIQLSDEFYYENLQEHNSIANYCELFLRQYHHSNYFYTKNTVQLPLAYCNDTPIKDKSILKINDRDLSWSFVGTIKSDRLEMIEKFKSIENHFVSSSLSKEEMVDVYNRSIFVPSGRGNSSLNCFRLYEASMCGAIPIVVGSSEEIENTFAYEENPPWIFADSWDEAVEKCKDLLNDKDNLQEVQNNLLSWWNNRINKIQDKISMVFNTIEYEDHSHKLKNFPPINFISVDKSEDRRKLLYEKFDKYNLTNIRPHIFEVYKEEDHHYIGESFRELNGIGRGPTTSHLKAIKDWYFDTEEEYAFFCEDDISFETVEYWNFTWDEFFNSLPKDWECVQLCWVREGDMFVFSGSGVKLRHRCWCDWSACAYLIKRSHAKKLIAHYYRNGSFNLDFIGNDSHVRPKWAKDPVAETIVFSPLGNPKNSFINVSPVYGFPLFVEDFYSCESDLLKYDIGNVLVPQRVRNEMSYNTITNWWQMEGKNLKIKDIIDV